MRQSLCVALACACADPLPPAPSTSGSPIVNGQVDRADPGVVALVHSARAYCTGTLVASRVVLTAAHCIDPTFPGGAALEEVEVYVGYDTSMVGTWIPLEAGLRHPAWTPASLDNDLAVLLLASPAPADPVLLFAGSTESLIGGTARLVGFGASSAQGDDYGLKRQGTALVDEVMATTFRTHTSPAQTCFGDSGGPVLVAPAEGPERLVGVTSWGDPACLEYGVNTRVDAYLMGFIQPYLEAHGMDVPDGNGLDPGQACAEASQCASRLCIAAADEPRIHYCSRFCVHPDDCISGMTCVPTTGQSVCAFYPGPTPGAPGSECSMPEDCASSLCLDRVCTRRCHAAGGADCPLGFTCGQAPRAAEPVCLPAPAPAGWCTLGTRRPGSAGPRVLVFFLWLGLWLVQRERKVCAQLGLLLRESLARALLGKDIDDISRPHS